MTSLVATIVIMILHILYQTEKSQPKQRRLFFFLNGPNAAASIASTLIRQWWHCPHSPAAAAAIDRYLLPAGPTAANLQQREQKLTPDRSSTVIYNPANLIKSGRADVETIGNH